MKCKAKIFAFFILILNFTLTSYASINDISYETSFDDLSNWEIVNPENNLVDIENGSLHIDNSASVANNVTVTYKRERKYDLNYTFEWRIRIPKNTGTIINQIYLGKERTQINITNGGKNISIPTQEGTIKTDLTSKIANWNASQWHVWRVAGINQKQKIYIDNILIFEGSTQNWSNDFLIQFFANKGNELYVDYCKFDYYNTNIPVSYSTSNESITLAPFAKSENSTDGNVSINDNQIILSVNSTANKNVYAYSQLNSATDKMTAEFNMEITEFSNIENSIVLGNGSCYMKIMFFGDKIQYQNVSGTLLQIPIEIGYTPHRYKFVLYNGIATLYIDGTKVTSFRAYDSKENKQFQISSTDNTGQNKEMIVSDLKISNITASVVLEAKKDGIHYNNYSTQDVNASLIFSAMQGNKMNDVQSVNSFLKRQTTYCFTTPFLSDSKTDSIKVFLWSDILKLKPIIEPINILLGGTIE